MSRSKGFGLTRELENKKRAEYDEDLARKVCEWMNDVCKMSAGEYSVAFHQAEPISAFHSRLGRQDFILNKMLIMKDHDEVAVLRAVNCFMQRNLTRIHDYFK